MADYYKRFSFEVTLPKEARDYFIAAVADHNRRFETGFADGFENYVPCPVSADITVEKDGALWIRDDQGADPRALADVLHETLKTFNLDTRIGFEWSHDCSSPRLDAYGGGAAIVTKVGVEHYDTGHWLADRGISRRGG